MVRRIRRALLAGLAAPAAVMGLGPLGSMLPAAAQGAAQASGEVTKIDKAGGRVEIKHGEIKALDMPPMRMVFAVREAKMLDGLAVGDKVRFTAAKIDGRFTVTSISKER